jgi:hypothetical protein
MGLSDRSALGLASNVEHSVGSSLATPDYRFPFRNPLDWLLRSSEGSEKCEPVTYGLEVRLGMCRSIRKD